MRWGHWLPPDQTSAREKGLRAKIEDVFEAARSVCDSLGVPPLGVAFGPSMVEEADDSVTPQVRLALSSIPEGMCTCLFC